ncbi:thermonuclease family protein [Sphingobium boeckii]|uniref:Endonuclease YncB(Thermonuclease family) n=1 Tax=Sphingobium boeckii TaxID=1082345 RepID=A0A7W9ED83_9SPHN|nr:thermonuclease family protein [Sphingobium boeckii]MBB5685008.1 endonuclease YncB(thermonuclease family) [Sphingobium boeckii]
MASRFLFPALLAGVVTAGGAIGFAWPIHTEAQAEGRAVHFSLCHSGGGTNCVVDGDTIWLAGVKIRIMDIDAPETHPSKCPMEADLGGKATARLQALLNAGSFNVESRGARDTDKYGRQLRVLTRKGRSLGAKLVEEGLAREWGGARRPWC